jgi:hypothetical protein
LKDISNFNSPRKMLIFHSQLNKRGHCWGIVKNEMSIKVGKSNKTLDILNKSWSSLINNGLKLIKIHANAILEMTWYKNSTLFNGIHISPIWCKIQPPKVYPKQDVHGTHGPPRSLRNEDVINVINHKIIQVFIKNNIH